jgi:hypothetical protein
MESNSTLAPPARVVVLDAVAAEYVRAAIVHANRDAEMIFAHGDAKQITGCPIQSELSGDAVKLRLGGLEKVI